MEMIHPTHDPRHMQVVVLDGDDFTIEEVVAVARYHAKVEFAPEFIERVNKSRANVSEEVLRQERAKSIAAVKKTNGQLRIEQKLRDMENDEWQG